MTTNEEIIRNLYRGRGNGTQEVPVFVHGEGLLVGRPCRRRGTRGDEVARAADIYSTASPDMHRELSTTSTSTATSSSFN